MLVTPAYSNVCQQLKAIDGFYTASLFNEAILNGKAIDYYTFNSVCQRHCLAKVMQKKGLNYRAKGSNIAVFDRDSVATIVVEDANKQAISGYLTCSTRSKRAYIPIPVTIDYKKVTLDLQTLASKTLTRTLNLQAYSKNDYKRLLRSLDSKAMSKEAGLGFITYQLRQDRNWIIVKVSQLNPNGDFMLIIEKKYKL
jgi:hypothetical protein